MESQIVTVADACLAAYQRLLNEILRFRASQLYFLRLEYGAMQDGGRLREAHEELVKQLTPDYSKPSHYFMERSFILLVAAFELYLQDILAAIIMANPKKVGHAEFRLSEILDSSGTDELVRRGIEETLNKLMYKRPNEYLTGIADLLSIDPVPLKAKWSDFVEAKARRDLGVHNGWKCNATYLRKVTEVGMVPGFALGQSTSPSEREYFVGVMDSLQELARQILDGVIEKHSASLDLPHKA